MSQEYTPKGQEFQVVVRGREKFTPENLNRIDRLPAQRTFIIFDDRELDREDLNRHHMLGGPNTFHAETVSGLLRPADLVFISCGALTYAASVAYTNALHKARRVVGIATYSCRIDCWFRATRPIVRPDALVCLGLLPAPSLTGTLDERFFHPTFSVDFSRVGSETIH